jgi:hypothetical protein
MVSSGAEAQARAGHIGGKRRPEVILTKTGHDDTLLLEDQ